MLYPLKFTPILKEKIWGGERLKTLLNHDIGTMKQCGESWEVSGIVGDESEVANGFLYACIACTAKSTVHLMYYADA